MKLQATLILSFVCFTLSKAQTDSLKNIWHDVDFSKVDKCYTKANTIKPLNKNDSCYFCEKTFDGIITKEGFKKDGLLNGEIRFYEQGKLINIFFYENDLPNGFYSAYYYPSGKINITGNFKVGKKDGVFKEYDINGKLISTKKYRDDEQIK